MKNTDNIRLDRLGRFLLDGTITPSGGRYFECADGGRVKKHTSLRQAVDSVIRSFRIKVKKP